MDLRFHEYPTREALAEGLATGLAAVLATAIDARGAATLAVSGGSTPRLLFERLSQADIEWDRVCVFLVDERWVDEDSDRSNARLVRWSDGSQQLLLGRDVLDVRAIDVSADQQFLLARHAQTIQGQGQLACKLVFRPASLESAFHRRLAASVDGGAARAAPKVRGTATVADPARAKRERELHEEAGIRERERAAERKARTLQRNAAYRPAAPRLSSAYLEEEDEPAYEEEGLDLRRPRYDPDEEVRDGVSVLFFFASCVDLLTRGKSRLGDLSAHQTSRTLTPNPSCARRPARWRGSRPRSAAATAPESAAGRSPATTTRRSSARTTATTSMCAMVSGRG